MIDGLILSTSLCESLPSAGPVLQPVLFADDTTRQITELEQRLRESESAYDHSCSVIAALQAQTERLRHENQQLRAALDAVRRVEQVITRAAFSCVRR